MEEEKEEKEGSGIPPPQLYVTPHDLPPLGFAVHPCKDGHVVFLQMERQPKFERFAKNFAPHMLADDRFKDGRGRMVTNNNEFKEEVGAHTCSSTH
jgi:crotonobetainyl-CoA:carnitine CoA-transferase CaiB-like acyl-CoA transferase